MDGENHRRDRADKGNDKMIRLRYGNTNTFFINGKHGNLLVDTDYAGTLPAFYKEIKRNKITLPDITYVLATHYHPDHIGLVSELVDSGVKLFLMRSQVEYVHFADEIFRRDKDLDYKPIDETRARTIGFEESRAFLGDMGIGGEIIPTPSHSEDSVSVILDDGSCIVGDLEPIEYAQAYENNAALSNDWKQIMSRSPRIVYYAHANEKIMAGDFGFR